jgi:hypothetical protein
MYFNRAFENLPSSLLEELRTLEQEGNVYAQFWYDESDESRYCRIPFKPPEIVEYVDSLTAYDGFLGYRSEIDDDSEALNRISHEAIKTRVRDYNEWARDHEDAPKPFVPAAFYSDDLESLLIRISVVFYR